MAKYQLETKPKAILEPIDPQPVDRGDGATTQRWRTQKGVVHVQLVYPGGRTEWYLVTEA